jgi:TetR/AcrR family transcriptional regulator
VGVQERKEKVRSVKREEIIDAAERVFFAKGFLGATMDDMAKEAEYTKRTIYAYFDSKDELYNTVVLRAFQALTTAMISALSQVRLNSGSDKVVQIGQAYFNFALEQPAYFRIIHQFEQPATVKEGSLAEACCIEGRKSFDLLISALKEGIADGSVRADLNVMQTAFLLNAGLVGTIEMIHFKRNWLDEYGESPEELSKTMFSWMTRMIEK